MRIMTLADAARKRTLAVRRLQDYHTVQNTKTANGDEKPCHITHRQYLTDASFGVLIEGNAVLLIKSRMPFPIRNGASGLGTRLAFRRRPVLAGLRDSHAEALKLLIGEEPLESFTRQEDAESFAEGLDSLPDQPVSFASDRRMFSPRRVRTSQGT